MPQRRQADVHVVRGVTAWGLRLRRVQAILSPRPAFNHNRAEQNRAKQRDVDEQPPAPVFCLAAIRQEARPGRRTDRLRRGLPRVDRTRGGAGRAGAIACRLRKIRPLSGPAGRWICRHPAPQDRCVPRPRRLLAPAQGPPARRPPARARRGASRRASPTTGTTPRAWSWRFWGATKTPQRVRSKTRWPPSDKSGSRNRRPETCGSSGSAARSGASRLPGPPRRSGRRPRHEDAAPGTARARAPRPAIWGLRAARCEMMM